LKGQTTVPNLGNLLADRAETDIHFSGASVHIAYRPSAYTPEMEAALDAINTLPSNEALALADQTICDIVESWDLTFTGEDKKEHPIPLTPADIAAHLTAVIRVSFALKLVGALAGEAAGGQAGAAPQQQQPKRPMDHQEPKPNRAQRRQEARS
jgi:hypothetical protein